MSDTNHTNEERDQRALIPPPPYIVAHAPLPPTPETPSRPMWNGESPERWIQDDYPQPEKVRRRVDTLYRSLDFDVDIIPPSWDIEIQRWKSGRLQPDYEAQRVLAFLLTWHRTSPAGQGKFGGRGLQLSWSLLAERFSLASNAVGHVLNRLDQDHGLIHRVSGPRGKGKGAYLFLAPNMDRVEAITYPVVMDAASGRLESVAAGDPFIGGPYLRDLIAGFELANSGFRTTVRGDLIQLLSVRAPGISQGPVNLPVHPSSDPLTPEGHASKKHDQRTGPLTDAHGGPAGSEEPDATRTASGRPPHHPRGSGVDAGHQTATNASSWNTIGERERRLERQVKGLRRTWHGDLKRAAENNARRAVARRAWLTAGRLQTDEQITTAVANAWQRLETQGLDPGLELVALALLACGRVHGSNLERKESCASLLNAVCRDDLDADLLERPISEDALQTALRAALMHRLDRDNAPNRIVALCAPGSRSGDLPFAFAFAHALVRRFSSPDVPLHAPLMAGAMAASIRDHDAPTPRDLLAACHAEATRLRYTPVPEGSKVRIGCLHSDEETGALEFMPDPAVQKLGRRPQHYVSPARSYKTVDDELLVRVVDVQRDRKEDVLIATDGSRIRLSETHVVVEDSDLEWIADRNSPIQTTDH